MKSMIALLFLMFAGCASAPTRHTLRTAPQVCEEFCHDYALGLVDLGSAGQAGLVFDIAEKHFQDTSRSDIPKKDWERAAMRVELALGRAASARVTGGDIRTPLVAAVKAFSELLEMQSPELWNWIALDFLRDADILRFDREWDALNVDPGARFVLRQFLLVQRDAAPDLLLIKERANSVKGLNQLVALSFILSNSGDARTLIAQNVNERLFDELKTADVSSQHVVLEMELTENFVYWATFEHQESVRWILQKATETGVRNYFMPVTSFADVSERCDVVKPYYKTLLARVRNDLVALDLVMGCISRWGAAQEITQRMNQLGPQDVRTDDWNGFLYGQTGGAELSIAESRSTQLLKGQVPVHESPQVNGLPWDRLYRLRHAQTINEFDTEWRGFTSFPWWRLWFGHYAKAIEEASENHSVLDDYGDGRLKDMWQATTLGVFEEPYCNWVLEAAFFEARRGGVRAVFPLLKLAPSCVSAQSAIREVFVTGEHHLELAPENRLNQCSAEKLKRYDPNSNTVVWCDVITHRVKRRAIELEAADNRNYRDTAVHALIALENYQEARALFETYGIVQRNDYITDQLLRIHEGKTIDIPGIRFSSIWGETFPHQEIVPALWATGRHQEACEVLTALTTVRPWVAHPGNVDCPATNAAYKERRGFDPPWTLPQDEILAFLRQAPETK